MEEVEEIRSYITGKPISSTIWRIERQYGLHMTEIPRRGMISPYLFSTEYKRDKLNEGREKRQNRRSNRGHF